MCQEPHEAIIVKSPTVYGSTGRANANGALQLLEAYIINQMERVRARAARDRTTNGRDAT